MAKEKRDLGKAGNPYAGMCLVCYAKSKAVYDDRDCPHCGAIEGRRAALQPAQAKGAE